MNLIEWPYYRTEFLASQGLSPTFLKRFWEKVNKNGPVPNHIPELGPCWLWTGARLKAGYGHLLMGVGSFKKELILSHVASWIIHHGPIPEHTPWILHKCDTPPCVRIDHLFVGTRADNSLDAIEKGRQPFGESHWNSKLTAEDIDKIRTLYSKGHFQREIASMFGITQGHVSTILSSKVWHH